MYRVEYTEKDREEALKISKNGAIAIFIFIYFEYMDYTCMHKCINEWKYSEDICNRQYCN